ncbi:Protein DETOXIFICATION 14 (AtDTX14) (Multidrug and toxic compound extrusion protein 14) (MATE protein 14) [Durusdinium trenchii]|uniref:Protein DETOXIFICATION 14 (AtDTX14) (Multidrug and toxic compound extrusion protein 14) (MATE protein 14) n=1 Tax=Durusdinium trenchii TaxID=1381693 RepID=A0ABP0NGI3_9DINO
MEKLNDQKFLDEAQKQLYLAAPVCLGLLTNRLIVTTAAIIVGHRSQLELAALGLAVSIANVTGYTIIIAVAGALQTVAGQGFGARNVELVSLSLQRCFLLSLVIVVPVAFLWINGRAFLLACGQQDAVASLAGEYLTYLVPGLFCYAVAVILEKWLAAQRLTQMQATGGVVELLGYVPLCWSLVNSFNLGASGAAIACSLGHVFLMCWMIFQTNLALKKSLVCWHGVSMKAFSDWGPLLRLVLPSLLMVSKWWAAEIIVLLSGTLQKAQASLAAMTIFSNTCLLCAMPPLSLGCAANIRVSNELGAGRPEIARFSAQVTFVLGIALAFSISTVVFLARRWWVGLITSDLEVQRCAEPVLLVCALNVAFDCICTVSSGSLKGCGRQVILAPVVILCYFCIGIPSAWLSPLPGGSHRTVAGLALGSSLGTATHTMAVCVILWTTNWVVMSARARERAHAPQLLLQ